MKFLERLRILSVLIFVAFLSMAVRIADVATGWQPYAGASIALAEDQKKAADDTHADSPKTQNQNVDPADMKAETQKLREKWKDASDSDLDFSGIKEELVRELAERRKKLMGRERDIDRRDALLKAAEKELDRKYQELEKLRSGIQELLKEQSEEEQARITSLVKIYEGMKAKDAARIFNTLDMDVLLSVMSRMSERKLAPILAEMDADKARTVTILLAEQKSLPKLPEK